jgi:membrane protein required for beta-lactamase induction
MDDRTSQPNNDPQLDEAVWNAWVKRNETKDKIRSARRKKILGMILILGVVVLLVWKLTGFGVAFRL